MNQKPDDVTKSTIEERARLGDTAASSEPTEFYLEINRRLREIAALSEPTEFYLEFNRRLREIPAFSGLRRLYPDPSILRIQILEEPLKAQNLSTIITAITDLYTRCRLIKQKRFADLMDYAQNRDPRFIKEANLYIGTMTHSSPAIIDFLLNAGTVVGGAATLALTLTRAIDSIVQTPLRFEATELKNVKERQEQEIRGRQFLLDHQIALQKAETEDKGKQQEQQLEADRKLFELEKQRMLLDIEKQKFEVETEKERAKIARERLEFEKNRVVIVQEIAVTMVSQLLSSEDRTDVGRTEMLVHSLVPSLLQLAATDGVVTVVPIETPKEENKETPEVKP